MAADGLETNEPGSRDLCPGTSSSLSAVSVRVSIRFSVEASVGFSHVGAVGETSPRQEVKRFLM